MRRTVIAALLAALSATFSGGETSTVDWNLYGPVD
jgi:hypothetical protein